jgi:hypothetical protein
MGLVLVAMMFACSVAALAGVCVYKICKWLGRPDNGEKFGVITAMVWWAAWIAPALYGASWLTTTEGLGLSGDKADAVLAYLQAPPGAATDLCYRRTYQNFNADFTMSEKDFLAWMKSRGWLVKRFTFQEEGDSAVPWTVDGLRSFSIGNDVTPVRLMGKTQDWIFVLDGYCHYDPSTRPECSRTIIYDVKARRVYVDN